jgi:hypothetical protein
VAVDGKVWLFPPLNFVRSQHQLPTLQVAKPNRATMAVAGKNGSPTMIWGLRGSWKMYINTRQIIIKKIISHYL